MDKERREILDVIRMVGRTIWQSLNWQNGGESASFLRNDLLAYPIFFLVVPMDTPLLLLCPSVPPPSTLNCVRITGEMRHHVMVTRVNI